MQRERLKNKAKIRNRYSRGFFSLSFLTLQQSLRVVGFAYCEFQYFLQSLVIQKDCRCHCETHFQFIEFEFFLVLGWTFPAPKMLRTRASICLPPFELVVRVQMIASHLLPALYTNKGGGQKQGKSNRFIVLLIILRWSSRATRNKKQKHQ